MSNTRALHERAMELLDESRSKLNDGDTSGAESYLLKAYELERDAAESMRDRYDLEPTRSILYKGAALLALENKLYREAEQLACMGLAGNPCSFVAEREPS